MYKIYLYALSVEGRIPLNEKFPYTDIGEISTMMRYVYITKNVLSYALDKSLIEAGFPKDLVRENKPVIAFGKRWSVYDAHPTSEFRKSLQVEGMSPIGIERSIESGEYTAHKVHGSHRVIYVISDKNTQKSQEER